MFNITCIDKFDQFFTEPDYTISYYKGMMTREYWGIMFFSELFKVGWDCLELTIKSVNEPF